MENTIESPLQGVVKRYTILEAIELSALGFFLWIFLGLASLGAPNTDIFSFMVLLILIEVGLLGSWLIYNLYIRIARAGGRIVDVVIWVIATSLTASYTFWAWSILDINRWIVTKLFYRGEAPVEYAWSARSKQIRKLWEAAHKLD